MLAVITNHVAGQAIDLAKTSLSADRNGFDVIEETLNKVEMDPSVPHVGIGGLPNILGVMNFDGGMMDGTTGEVGSVARLSVTPRAASVARRIMEWGIHTTLVGEGADRFAREQGIVDSDLLSDKVKLEYIDWCRHHFKVNTLSELDFSKINLAKELPGIFGYKAEDEKDTAVVAVLSGDGALKVGTSTSGWGFSYPGRVGDSPMMGGGFYARTGVGAAVCTHTGENAYRALASARVVNCLEAGLGLQKACERAADDILSLKNGTLGPVVIHAIDKAGEAFALAVRFSPGEELPDYHCWREGQTSPEQRKAVAYGPICKP